ncbi:cobalamin 5'-phosphate synthase [Gloeothece citriformis PCC 7424]|uniref:Adenosylcobinamide-GDP ribazoletransferase n=1 Tax=Gloeothece citriformis (strain PCC 7424) TaxID=65393 RepID=B7KCS4_GLOC7|nr:adenosylcobinamide-GDP ribazoletransferase [Gloeothece citriformis]ACK71625.1 cobalamin 5'-phosphate synthase [Gloeothece citriformis PCC 7424]
MKLSVLQSLSQKTKSLIHSFLGAVTFYTIIGIPSIWQLDFERICRWSPLIGVLMGATIGAFDFILDQIGVSGLTRSALIVAVWVRITGGLHLDGVMDTADGLGVWDHNRRLSVMQDSVTGAFGVMAAVIVLLLKTAAVTDLASFRWFGFMIAAGWGRWGQVAAIAFYPYLKPTGKGAFHKQSIRLPQDLLLGVLILLGLGGVFILLEADRWWIGLIGMIGGAAIALLTGFWFYRQLGGHTGDTYGAVVEWTEALLLCFLTAIFN